MNQFIAPAFLALCLGAVSSQSCAQNNSVPMPVTPKTAISPAADALSRQMLTRFEVDKLKADEFAFSLLDLNDPQNAIHYREGEPIYPASVVKLFYAAALQNQLESGQLSDTPELQRALKDMIVESSNDATALVLDMLTGTTGGPELTPDEFASWSLKRNSVNRYFAGLGFGGINVNQKPWNEGPYGRERQWVGATYGNRNKLTTAATARLLAQIGNREWVSTARSDVLLELLKRDFAGKPGADSQATEFIGIALREVAGAKLWAKAG